MKAKEEILLKKLAAENKLLLDACKAMSEAIYLNVRPNSRTWKDAILKLNTAIDKATKGQ